MSFNREYTPFVGLLEMRPSHLGPRQRNVTASGRREYGKPSTSRRVEWGEVEPQVGAGDTFLPEVPDHVPGKSDTTERPGNTGTPKSSSIRRTVTEPGLSPLRPEEAPAVTAPVTTVLGRAQGEGPGGTSPQSGPGFGTRSVPTWGRARRSGRGTYQS